MLYKPRKPDGPYKHLDRLIHFPITLQELMDLMFKYIPNKEDALKTEIELNINQYPEEPWDIDVSFDSPETQEEYNERLSLYEERLKIYNSYREKQT